MVVNVGLEQFPQRPRVRLNHRTKVSRFGSILSSRGIDQEPEEIADNAKLNPILISRIDRPLSARASPKLHTETAQSSELSSTQAPIQLKLLDRILRGKNAFWVVPNKLLLSADAARDNLPSALVHTHIGVIARIHSQTSKRQPIRYQSSARVVTFMVEPRHISLATILYDLAEQILRLMVNEVVLIQCQDDEGWELAICTLLFAGSGRISISQAISQLRLLCMKIEKRWTIDAHTESVLLHQVQHIPRVMNAVSETDSGRLPISLGAAGKPKRRLNRPMLAALQPSSTRIAVEKPFNPVSIRRLIPTKGTANTDSDCI